MKIQKNLVESNFKDWWNKISNMEGREWMKKIDPNDPNLDYDYKLFFEKQKDEALDMLNKDSDYHFTDIGKRPWHATFSNESAYHSEDTPGGSWVEHKESGTWEFQHSDFTVESSDKTEEYLKDTDEYATYKGGKMLESVTLKE